MTKNEITRRFPNASAAFIAANLDPENSGPAAVVEHDPGDAPLAAETLQRPDRRQFLVRVTSFRRRLLDEDNLCEKYHVDLCRYAGAIPDDAPGETLVPLLKMRMVMAFAGLVGSAQASLTSCWNRSIQACSCRGFPPLHSKEKESE